MKPKLRTNRLTDAVLPGLWMGLMLGLFACQSAVRAQNFHLLVFADTDDPGLSAPNLMNISYLTEVAETVCQSTGMKNRMVVYKGADFLASRCDQVLATFRPDPNDVVFFYFMGHGWNNAETEEPMLLFKTQGQSPGIANSRNLKTVFEQLRRKGNRLTLAFGESCNSAINDRSRAKKGSGAVMNVSDYNVDQLRNLFLASQGAILLHTCKRGQKSNSSEDGGWFFTSFLDQFKRFTARSYKQQPAQWEPLLLASANATAEYAREQGAVQEPVFRVLTPELVRSVAAVSPTKPTRPMKAATETTELPAPSPPSPETGKSENTATVGEPGNTCAINRTAYNTMRSHLSYLENFRSRVMGMEAEAAANEFRKYYSTDRQEFFHQIPRKLNVGNLASGETKWFADISQETAELLDETAYYLDDPQFRNNAFRKLATPIVNLRSTVERVQDLLRRCKE